MMPRMRLCAFLAIVLCYVAITAQSTQKPLTNTDVVDMVHAGLDEGTIVLAIKNSRSDFDTSPRALIELKKNGVGKSVLDAMLRASASGGSSAAAAPTTAAGPVVSAPAAAPAGNSDGRALMAKAVNALGGEKAIAAVMATRTTTVREIKTADA